MLNFTNKLKIVSITEKDFKNIFKAKVYIRLKQKMFVTSHKRVFGNITIVDGSWANG